MEVLGYIFKVLWSMPAKRFWLVWIGLTASALTYVLTVVRAASTQEIKKGATGLFGWRKAELSESILAAGLLAIFLTFYIALILMWEDFSYDDNSILTLAILKRQALGAPIWPQNGRFFPFGLLEFNVVNLFTDSPVGYQLLPVCELLIFSCILLTLDAKLSIVTRAMLAIACLLTPSILVSFSGLIYSERNILFFLSCLMLSFICFEKTRSTIWAMVAVVSAQMMIYYKETAFLLLFGFAGSRLFLRWRKAVNEGPQDLEWFRNSESRLNLCLMGLAVAFLLSYFMMIGLHPNLNYAIQARRPLKEVLLDYLGFDLLAWVFAVLVIGRVYLILRRRAMPELLWDGLALGGLAYLAAYQSLRMFSSYYLAPVDLIAVLYVGRFVILGWSKSTVLSRVVMAMIACAIMVQNIGLSGMAIFERKNAIHAKTEMASVIQGLHSRWPGHGLRLFFPFAHPYVIMEFAYYLNYRGVSLDRVSLVAATIAQDGLCVNYRDLKCYAGRTPAPGDLVIVLPEDQASLAKVAPYRDRRELLFSYEPWPYVPHGLYTEIGGFALSGSKYSERLRPDRWMDASVTRWR
jgi:hypothetical protein